MAISSNTLWTVNTASTFSGWLNNTNLSANALNNVALTSDTSPANATQFSGNNYVATIGTVTHNGAIVVYTLNANTITTSSNALTFQSTAVVLDAASSLTSKGSIVSNGAVSVGNNVTVTGSTSTNTLTASGNSSFAGIMTVVANSISDVVSIGNTSVSANVTVYGNIYATGNIQGFQPSDKRLKDNVKPIQNDLINKVLDELPAVEFDWNELAGPLAGLHSHGVIAQDLQKILPYCVGGESDGYLGVNYIGLIPVLLAIVQRQQGQIDRLIHELHPIAVAQTRYKAQAAFDESARSAQSAINIRKDDESDV